MLRYAYLKAGDRFRFVYGWPVNTAANPEDPVHTKLSGRKYRDGESGKVFVTGAQVTVERVLE